MHVRILELFFFNFLNLVKSMTVLSALLLPLTTLLLSVPKVFSANNPNNSVVFKIKISSATILLKQQRKRQKKFANLIKTCISHIDFDSDQL